MSDGSGSGVDRAADALAGLSPEDVAAAVVGSACAAESRGLAEGTVGAVSGVDWAKALRIAIAILQQIAPLLGGGR